MQQPRSKTYEEMVADLLEMEQKSQDPNSTPERRKAFSDAADTIRRKLASAVGTPISAPPRHRRTPAQSPQPRSAKKFTIVTPSPESGVPKIPQASPTRYQQRHSTVEIEWSDGTTETLRYHQVRSRFGVCLTDLLQSVAHRKGDDTHKRLENYVAYNDGQTYYAALTTLWGKAPTFEQLNITSEQHPEADLREMFNKLTAT